MILEDAIVARIAANVPGLIIGKSLFHSHMPAETNAGVLVMTRVPIEVDPYTGVRKGTFQVICRDLKIADAHNRATTIMKAIVSEGVQQGLVRFMFIKPVHEPLVFPRTPGGQFEAAVNYNFAADWS